MNINDRCRISATIQQAVIKNNEGTRLVRQCQYNSAMKSFTSVLEMLEDNDRFETDTDDKNDTNTTTSSSSTVPFVIRFMNNNSITMYDTEEDSNDTTALARTNDTMNDLSLSPEVLSSTSTSMSASASASASYTHKSNASKDNCNNDIVSSFSRKPKYFVFRDPVFILPESLPSRAATTRMTTVDTYSNDNGIDDNGNDDAIDDDDLNELSLYSSDFFSKFPMIVMYNLALTLHLHALSLASLSSSSSNVTTTTTTMQHVNKLFFQSKKLYELAFEMQLDANVDILFSLALINNLGLINYTLNAKDRSKTCFKHLFSIMMYLMDSNKSQSIKEWDGLLSNAIDILKIGNAVAAPAA